MKNEYGIEMNGKNCFCHNKQRCKDRDCSVCEMFKPKSKVYRERIMELQNEVEALQKQIEAFKEIKGV